MAATHLQQQHRSRFFLRACQGSAEASRSGIWVGSSPSSCLSPRVTQFPSGPQGSGECRTSSSLPCSTPIRSATSEQLHHGNGRRALANPLDLPCGSPSRWSSACPSSADSIFVGVNWPPGAVLGSNPNSSFLYVFTGVHHCIFSEALQCLFIYLPNVVGGHTSLRRHRLDNTAIYLAFHGRFLWLYLLFVISTRLSCGKD